MKNATAPDFITYSRVLDCFECLEALAFISNKRELNEEELELAEYSQQQINRFFVQPQQR